MSMSPDATSRCSLRPDAARLTVPRKHGQVLIEPPLLTLQTALRRGCPLSGNLLGVPFSEVRQRARADLLQAASQHAALIGAPTLEAGALSKPWVLTGHQVEFYHAGVWAKVLASDALARRTGAVALDLLVDHDVVEDLGFDVPERLPDGKWKRTRVEWSEAPHIAADGLAVPSRETFAAWDATLARVNGAESDALAMVLAALQPAHAGAIAGLPHGYTAWMSRSRRALENALGLQVHHVPTSRMCESSAWHLFVLAWVANADAWSAVYNTHLAAYRQANGIHNDHHPMPDLHRDGALELPFWIYRVGQPRARLIVRFAGGQPEVHLGFEAIALPAISAGAAWEAAEQMARVLAERQLVIRPRALTLTMYVRLLLSDLFIHGIGGALYDQITNGLMEDLCGVRTSYGCVSAAWLLPLGQPVEAEADISALCHERHHLQHNPQLGIDPFTALTADFAELLTHRRECIAHIQQSLQRARRDETEPRHTWFAQLHELNQRLHEKSPQILQKLDARITAARAALEQNKVLLWREYYFGLHTLASLRELMRRVASE